MLTYTNKNGTFLSEGATKHDWNRIGEIERLEKELQLDVLHILRVLKGANEDEQN